MFCVGLATGKSRILTSTIHEAPNGRCSYRVYRCPRLVLRTRLRPRSTESGEARRWAKPASLVLFPSLHTLLIAVAHPQLLSRGQASTISYEGVYLR